MQAYLSWGRTLPLLFAVGASVVHAPSRCAALKKAPDSPLWKSLVSQKIQAPEVRSDGRVKVRASLSVDASRVEEFNGSNTYVAIVGMEITNVGKKKVGTGNGAMYMRTSDGRLYSCKDSGSSSSCRGGLLKPGQNSETAWQNTGYDGNSLFRVTAPTRITQVIYADGKSKFAWEVRSTPSKSP